jgi:Fe-S cluster biogenesis protein NfuA
MTMNIPDALLTRINAALDTIRPHLHVDGGDVEVVELTDDNRLLLRWLGNCQNCQMSAMTMKAGVEQAIRNQIPEIRSVEAINGTVGH